MDRKYVIVRGDRSGVFFGEFIERKGREVKLANCRRLWYWDGACSISQLAVDGTSFLVRMRLLNLLCMLRNGRDN